MHVVAAPDKMRGTATAQQIATAICAAVTASGATCDAVPVADGGEGMLDVLGGGNRTTTVTGPLGEPVEAAWRLTGRTAVIEMARASGLALTGDANDAVAATTRGTGELITAALEAGARRILVGLGGSATTDGGLGCLDALTLPRLRGVDLVVACDVRTTFVDAARVYGPQKGASPAQVDLLTRRLERLVDDYRARFDIDVTELEGGGAAGGLAGALAAVGGRLVPGFDLVADELDLEERIERAGLVVSAEGFLDDQSFEGKVVGGLLDMCTALDVPLLVIAGRIFDGAEERVDAVSLVDAVGEERALHDTLAAISEVVARELSART